jgi:nucleoside-diphosphate-sugar epimerase
MKVAVLGAGGLVGGTLVRRLIRDGRAEVRACVRNPANAWSLIGLGVPLTTSDLRDRSSISGAIDGCTHVVNCALGDDRHLRECMENLVLSCKTSGIRRLVHLSSVAVYGEPPPPESAEESAVPQARRGTYGWQKLQQDEVAFRAHRSGLSTAVLCLPHVTGPGSRFLLSLIRELGSGQFAFIDGGRHPVVMADVENVAEAICAAMVAPGVDGRRMFINDGPAQPWSSLVAALAPMAGIDAAGIPRLTTETVRGHHEHRLSPIAAIRQMTSIPEVRRILSKTSLGSDAWLIRMIKRAAKRRIAPTTMLRPGPASTLQVPPSGLWSQQLRMVDHSNARARSVLGFQPPHTFEASMSAFERWYSRMHLYGSSHWDMACRIRGG